MVARVDTVLREELGIATGLADPRVYVLDPCTGTGSYLVAVLKRIAATLQARTSDALLGAELKQAAMERVFGFEILPAPFVVAHLQLGLLLQNYGVPMSETKRERAAIFLTNALTGWQAPEKQTMLPFAELQEERDAAEQVKRDRPILVVLGNPPYNGFAGVAVDEERALSDAYRTAKTIKQPQGQGLNDLYVRFFRMAERRIVERTGCGVVCFISNYSWLDGLSFTAMRERYLEVFDKIWIDCLNGDKYKTGKLTPDGKADPSIFSTQRNPEGIQVGTSIALMVRKEHHVPAHAIEFRHLWGRDKRAKLLVSAGKDIDAAYQTEVPRARLGLPLLPMASVGSYLDWPLLPSLLPTSFPGVKTSRDDVVVDIDRARLIERMGAYFSPSIGHETMNMISPGAMESGPHFDAVTSREILRKRGFLPKNIVEYYYRPFDVRWLYWEPETALLDRKREQFASHVFPGNLWLSAGQRNRKEGFYQPQVTSALSDHHIVESNVAMFPLYLRPNEGQVPMFHPGGAEVPRPNVTNRASYYLDTVGVDAQDLFFHIIAVLHAPGYRLENAGALRQDWPRIPLPESRDVLLASARLGQMLAALLDSRYQPKGFGADLPGSEVRDIAVVSHVGGGMLDPSTGDLALTVGWGHLGKGRATMPGRGRLVMREYTDNERSAIGSGANPLGLSMADPIAPLGDSTYDVYLNERAYWRNVPARVWEYQIGGYPVMKKWLSYREESVLRRSLTRTEVYEMTTIAQRIASILLLEPRLDFNYQSVGTNVVQWPQESAAAFQSPLLW